MIRMMNKIILISKSFNHLNQNNHSSDKKHQQNLLPLALANGKIKIKKTTKKI
jgi:hypothetical protein